MIDAKFEREKYDVNLIRCNTNEKPDSFLLLGLTSSHLKLPPLYHVIIYQEQRTVHSVGRVRAASSERGDPDDGEELGGDWKAVLPEEEPEPDQVQVQLSGEVADTERPGKEGGERHVLRDGSGLLI